MLTMQVVEDEHCQGVAFLVTHKDLLAKTLAMVLVQEYGVARAILDGRRPDTDTRPLDEVEVADIVTRRLRLKDRYHRDGYMFQLIMWLAAQLDLPEGDLISLPHSQATAKGQDCIIVHRSDTSVEGLSICEDKATENARNTIREEVWPEIEAYEKGGRRDELRSSTIAILGTGGINTEEATALIRNISWEGKRRYRVRVTVDPKRTKGLFKGFLELVPGPKEMRRGETVNLPQIREWMDDLAAQIEVHLSSLVTR